MVLNIYAFLGLQPSVTPVHFPTSHGHLEFRAGWVLVGV